MLHYVKHKKNYYKLKAMIGGEKSIADIARDIVKSDYISYKNYISQFEGVKIKRSDEFDIKFLTSIGNMFNDRFDGMINGKNYNINVNFENLMENRKSMYWLEEIFLNDVPKIYEEYDTLSINRKSKYIYRSNLVNFAIMLKCYHNKCFDEFLMAHPNEKKYVDKELLHTEFEKNKDTLINKLINAYDGFEYEKICHLYISYLEFFKKTINESLNHFIIGESFDDEYKIIMQNLQSTLSDNSHFVYLSFNIQPEYKMTPFEATTLAISHIGFRPAHKDLYNSIAVIHHDFDFHKQFIRLQDNPYIRNCVIKLYDNFVKYDSSKIFANKYVKMFYNTDDINEINELKKTLLYIYYVTCNTIYYIANEVNPQENQYSFTKFSNRFLSWFRILSNESINLVEKIPSNINPIDAMKLIDDSYTHQMAQLFTPMLDGSDMDVKYIAIALRILVDYDIQTGGIDNLKYEQINNVSYNLMYLADKINEIILIRYLS